jgi:predicted TIM-barrel fold metal-dependent hydrolase
MSANEPPLVDAHFHVWQQSMPLTEAAWHKKTQDATTEQLIAMLDAHGVTFGVIAAASLHGTYNDYVRQALRQHRRLRATAIVTPDMGIYELEQMKADGFVGIRLVLSVTDDVPDLRSGPYRKLLRRVADLDWHVHMMDKPHRTIDSLAAVEDSGVKLVIDHLGKLDTPEGVNGIAFKALMAAVERGRTWVKLSAGFRYDPPSRAGIYARELVKLTGGERLFWGSDWPFAAHEDKVKYADTIAAFEEWVPDPAMRRKIAGYNPLKFYFA